MSGEPGTSKSAQLSEHSFDAYNAELQNAVLKSTKLAVALPVDINFNRTVDNDFAQAIDSCSQRALRLTNDLLELSTSHTKDSRVKGKRKLEDQEDVLDSFGALVVDVLDQLLERADMSLDTFLGRMKPAAIPVRPTLPPSIITSSARNGRLEPSILHAAYLPKPQLKFKRKIDNTDGSSWSPNLKHKYNAQVPLGHTLHDAAYSGENIGLTDSTSQRLHPYFYEIKHVSYPRHMFEHREPVSPSSFENTPFTWIDNKESLDLLLDKLRHVHEITVDLEHHSYRSFSGFLCLMQISTREEDFILDTLALREELEDLNEVFTDPKIVKVFHGAESDVIWLQQDFNVYIVNLFDTYHASKLLDFPRHGLGALLEMYCDFVPDKRYQLADWRIRPLPIEMLKYARSDTHFLLYVYDNLRNALLDRARGQSDLIRAVLDRSQETALRVYEAEVYDMEDGNGPGGWNTLAAKWGRALSGLPRAVFRAVHAWRDAVARVEDESTRYVLPNHYVFQLAERPPADMAALLAIFRPVPPLVRTKAASLLDVIRAAVKESLRGAGVGQESNSVDHSQITKDDAKESLLRTKNSSEVAVRSENTSTTVEKVSSDLWTRQTSGLGATTSLLLGSQTNAKGAGSVDRSCGRSTLFSTGWIPSASNKDIYAASTRYQEVVSRIHRTLAVAPIISEVPIAIATPDINHAEFSVTSLDSANSAPVSGQIEIPFIPADQRRSHTLVTKVETTDTVIVVGRTRERKRKRSKLQEDTEKMDRIPEVKKTKGEAADRNEVDEAVEAVTEEFDYGSAPNFLDEPVKDQSVLLKSQKGKASKGRRAFEYGNFPAPPRAYNEVKGANMSRTFRK